MAGLSVKHFPILEETSALKESFSMVAHLIGPTKWIPLTKQMEVSEANYAGLEKPFL